MSKSFRNNDDYSFSKKRKFNERRRRKFQKVQRHEPQNDNEDDVIVDGRGTHTSRDLHSWPK